MKAGYSRSLTTFLTNKKLLNVLQHNIKPMPNFDFGNAYCVTDILTMKFNKALNELFSKLHLLNTISFDNHHNQRDVYITVSRI